MSKKTEQGGVVKDNSKAKSQWKKKPIIYLKEQLELRGRKFNADQFTGANKLSKGSLLSMLYMADDIM